MLKGNKKGRFGVVVFPGSNCDKDVYGVLKDIYKQDVSYVWHAEELNCQKFDCLVLPGGFSFGDYLRAGAIAKFSKICEKLNTFAESGKPILGICNGFQILLEAGLLPGAMMRNEALKFVCDWTELKLESNNSPFTSAGKVGQRYRIPVAHMEGNYTAREDQLKELEKNKQIIFSYQGYNPNGSSKNIAGIVNRRRNVLGMMPHPERCVEKLLGSSDGRVIFDSLLQNL